MKRRLLLLWLCFTTLVITARAQTSNPDASSSSAGPPAAASAAQPTTGAGGTGAANTPARAENGSGTTEPAASSGANAQQPPISPPLLPVGAPPEGGQQYVELKYNIDGTDLQGNAQRSFLHEGINHTAELSYFKSGAFGSVRRFELLTVGRYTNNPQVDPERNSLQRFFLRAKGPTFYASLGDDLVNYSRLTFNQNIKGLNMWKDLGGGWRLTGTVGFFADRWGDIYRNANAFRDVNINCQSTSAPINPITGLPVVPNGCVEIPPPGSGIFVLSPTSPTKPYTRLVGGSRLEHKLGARGWIAGNWSHGTDLLQSLPGAFYCVDSTGSLTVLPVACPQGQNAIPGSPLPTAEAADNDTASLETRVNLESWKLDLGGEFAYSWTVGGVPPAGAAATNFVCAPQSPIVGAHVLDARCFSDRIGDSAGRFEAAQHFHKFTWRLDYVRFGPDFFSANARQIRDLQDFGIRGDYSFTRQVRLAVGWRRSNDNLNGQRDFTSVVRAPEVRLSLTELSFYRRMSLEVGYRERNLENEGHPQVAGCPGAPPPATGSAPPLCEAQQTSTRIPFVSLAFPVGRTRFTFDYEHRHAEDAVNPQLSNDTGHYGIGLRGDYTFGQWEFSPRLRAEFERLNKSLPQNAAVSVTTSAVQFPNDFFGAYDTNRTYLAGFLLEAPRYFRFEGEYRELNSVILSPLQASQALLNNLPPGSPNFLYLNQGFRRPSWRAAVTYKIGNDENRRISFYYLRTNNFFATGDPFAPDLRSFRETVIGGTILLRFVP